MKTIEIFAKAVKFASEASDIPGTGVVQLWFDRQTDTLQLMSGIV